MPKKITYYSILVILIIGLFGAGMLVVEEFKTGDGCPKILDIPMCLVVLICFVILLIAHLLKKYNSIYFLFTGLAFLIAIVASVMQYRGLGECPKLNNGIPMCYLSFALFSTLIILKIILIKITKTT